MNIVFKISLIFAIIFSACKHNPTSQELLDKKFQEELNNFTFPKITQKYTKEEFQYWRMDSIQTRFPIAIRAKYSFFDKTISLPVDYHKLREVYVPDYPFFNKRIENKENFSIEYPNEYMVKLGINDLTILPDYKQNIAVKNEYNGDRKYFFPIYVVNSSQTPNVFAAKDGYVFAIQEAQNREGKWYPIEMKGFDFCGNGHWFRVLEPKEFMMFLMPKYTGNFKTKLRVRLKIGRKTLFSMLYEGYINEKQFNLYCKKNIDTLSEDEINFIIGRFYGTIPKELDKMPYNKLSRKNSSPAVISSVPH